MSHKILILRFSSIGDIVLTTPVIRACKEQLKDVELHFVCKSVFKPLLQHNPHIDKLYTFESDIDELVPALKKEKYTAVIDLHHNLRSFRLKKKLGVSSYHFKKLNFLKLITVLTKRTSVLPQKHIVERYFEAVAPLGVKKDNVGLEYFISAEDKILPADVKLPGAYTALVLGGSYYTKKIPLNKLKEICSLSKLPLVLLGAKEELALGKQLSQDYKNVINLCGSLSINQSAYVIQQSAWVISSDTGLMHIAAAFNKRIISVWGNTVPEFGMGPYLPRPENRILEVKDLSCRPCSKLGYGKCPKRHFNCMNKIDYTFLSEIRD